MLDFLKVLFVFIVILCLIRLKWNIGYVLITASGLIALLYLMPLEDIFSTIKLTLIDHITIKLFLSLTLIRVFEIILREREILAKMTEASKALLKKKKAVIISMPLLIGLLPSLGGAYFSAPMVDESTKGLNMSQEEKGFINYWFRHPWEFILPLYPGLLLASAITNIELRTLILTNLAYAILFILAGFMLSMRGVKGGFYQKDIENSNKANIKNFTPLNLYWSFIPLIFILVLVAIFGVELFLSLGIAILPLLVFYKYKIPDIVRVLKHGFALEVIVLIFGTMLFKMIMESSGAIEQLSNFFSETGIPTLPILVALPFIAGLLTGITVGFVSSTFPLLISLTGGAYLGAISLAFAAGYIGVLLSPVHLCLVLTREYFRADMWGIYKKIIPGCLLIFISALFCYVLLS